MTDGETGYLKTLELKTVNSLSDRTTPKRQHSKMLVLSKNVDQKIVRNRGFDCHLSPEWRQMATKNTVYSNF